MRNKGRGSTQKDSQGLIRSMESQATSGQVECKAVDPFCYLGTIYNKECASTEAPNEVHTPTRNT